MLLHSIFVIFMAALAAVNAYGAERIQVARFTAFGEYSSATTFGYTKQSGSGVFEPDSGVRFNRRHGCPSYLESFQLFPLQKMVDVGYLTPAQAKAYANLGSELHPTQMTFYTKVDPHGTPNLGSGENASFARDALFGHEGGEGKVLASMYSVATFQLDHQKGTMTHVPIPLELERSWKPVLDAHLPREKRLFLWEFGRAAQDGPGEIDDVIRAATLGCLNDLSAYALSVGQSFDEMLDHANVLFHAKDRAHVIAYMRRHPNALIIRHPLNDDDAVFVVSMREMVEKYQPQKISPVLTQMIRATNGALDPARAFFIWNFLKLHRWEELDFAMKGSTQRSTYPIIFSPVSSGQFLGTTVTNALLEEFGLPPSKLHAFMEVFNSANQAFHIYAPGKYIDVSDPGVTNPFFKPRHAQEISNLDPKLAKSDPQYIPSVLAGVYRHFLMLRTGHFNGSPGLNSQLILGMDQAFERSGVKFGITTLDPEVSALIRKLGPSEVVEHQIENVGGEQFPKHLDSEFAWLNRDTGKTYYMHFFTIDQIHRLATALQTRPNELPAMTTNSSWQMFYSASNPEIF